MPNLLHELAKTRGRDARHVQPRYSGKKNCVTVTVNIGNVPIECSISAKHLDTAIDQLGRAADGTGFEQLLLDELLHAWQRYAHRLDGKKKARGIQTGRRIILLKLKYASVWAHEFVTREWEKEPQDRYLPLQKAENRFKLEAGRSCHDPVEMAAFLVFHAYRKERNEQKIKTPWNDWGDFSSENYKRRYINIELRRRILERIRREPAVLFPIPRRPVAFLESANSHEQWKTAVKSGFLNFKWIVPLKLSESRGNQSLVR